LGPQADSANGTLGSQFRLHPYIDNEQEGHPKMKMETRKRAIDKVYKRRDRIEMPDFQREEVWPVAKKRLLIDSILRGWKLPKFYFRKLDEGTFECVDGQQRLVAILEFFDNKLTLDDETKKRYGGSKYSELPDQISDDFDDYEIDIEEIEEASDKELEELFLRLQLGTPLNTAEKLNALSGDMRDFCHKAATHDFFEKKIGLKNTRYAHFQAVVMWAFVEARGIHPQMRFPQLEDFLRDNRTFSSKSQTAQKIVSALDFLDAAFPHGCGYIRNRANTLTICMLAARVSSQGLTDAESAKAFGTFIDSFFRDLSIEVEKGVSATDKELIAYQQAITSGSTGGDSVKTRINILTRRLAEFSPIFSPLIGAYKGVEDDAIHRIFDLATMAREMIIEVNRRYQASHGEDLFKMTTSVAESFDILSQPTRDKDGYGKFMDALYFIVYESTGNCKRLPDPPPEFSMDIKFLRASLRHDLDHGSEKDIAKKAKRSAEAFRKYSGKETPEECGPEDFLSTQTTMLNKMIEFLEPLK
jgi:hypothetical protein